MRVVLYTLAAGCPLCDEALHHLERLRSRRPFDLRVVPVDGDPRLAIRHALRVPVLEVDGREVLFGRMTLEAVEAALLGAGAP
ncbi:MAG TPA: glutaredoxin family protein [Planctomycetota bacterium]|nr:glutaredoxin family protein [Planctomycetota bacterium]